MFDTAVGFSVPIPAGTKVRDVTTPRMDLAIKISVPEVYIHVSNDASREIATIHAHKVSFEQTRRERVLARSFQLEGVDIIDGGLNGSNEPCFRQLVQPLPWGGSSPADTQSLFKFESSTSYGEITCMHEVEASLEALQFWALADTWLQLQEVLDINLQAAQQSHHVEQVVKKDYVVSAKAVAKQCTVVLLEDLCDCNSQAGRQFLVPPPVSIPHIPLAQLV